LAHCPAVVVLLPLLRVLLLWFMWIQVHSFKAA
jgi:hypothetical protein